MTMVSPPQVGLPRRGRLHKTVAEVMHNGVIGCDLDMPVPQVARLMTMHDISAVPVVDAHGYLVGIITRTDLVVLRGYDDYWRELQAEHAMQHDLSTIGPDATVAEASRLMSQRKVHRLIVCDGDDGHQRPIGILSQTDIVRDMSLE